MKHAFLFGIIFLYITPLWSQSIEKSTNTSNSLNTKSVQKQEVLTDTISEKKHTFESEKGLKEIHSVPVKAPTNAAKRVSLESEKVTTQQQATSSASQSFQNAYKNSNQQYTRRSPSKIELEQMNQAATIYQVTAPESFEAAFYTYVTHKFDPIYLPNLKQAAQLEPENKQLKNEYFAYALANNDITLADSLSNSFQTTEGQNRYALDMINSIPKNATLLLHGYTDLVPVYTQLKKTNRTDITLIPIDLMQSKNLQRELTKKGYKLPASTAIDTTYFKTLCLSNTGKNLFVSLSFPKEYFQTIKNDIRVIGLTFAYKQETLNSDEMNFNLLFNQWDANLLGKSSDDLSDKLAANYLPALLGAKKQAVKYHSDTEIVRVQNVLEQVAQRANKNKQISEITR